MDQLVEPLLHQQQHVYRERCLRILKFLCRLHGLVFTVAVWRLKPKPLQETCVCYGALLNLTFALWMWAKNLEIFSLANVDLERDLLLPENERLGPNDIFQFIHWMVMAGTSTFTLHLLFYSSPKIEKWTPLAPAILYIAIGIYLIIDRNSPYHRSLLDLGKRLWQNILLFSAEDPQFANTFVADVMTSMMKVFVDIGSLLCRVVAIILGFSVAFCASGHLAYAVKTTILVLPNLIRLIQCIRLYNDMRNIIYAGKYLLASIVICLSQFHYGDWPSSPSASPRPFESEDSYISLINFYIWIGLSACNSVYSICCDIFLDWDLSRFDELLTSNQSIPFSNNSTAGTIWVIGSNFFIRFSWLPRLFLPASVDQDLVDFFVTFFEVYRRFQATIFRVHNFVKRENQRLAEIAAQDQENQEQGHGANQTSQQNQE